jgi:outer membrane receptor protein involved in Fe transport
VSTVGLRGFTSSQTVILVNGRALPRSSISSGGGPDISRIPLAAIERVELLPYAGSAIYGAGAIGGAINIILRKDYTGRDLTTYVGTSTEGGATEYRFTYLEGRSFNDGKTRLTLTLSHHHRDPLRANQRGFLAEALRRYGPGSTAVNNQGVPIFEQSLIPAFAGTPATIVVGNAPSAAVNDLGIPGAPGVRFAAVPAGTTAAQSFLLTPASFTATAGQASLSPRFGRSVIYEPVNSYSINAQVEHVFVKDKLSAYGEFTLGYNRRKYDFPQSLVFSLTATDPLNPFRTGVTPGFVGRPVTVYLDTPDIRDPSIIYENESARAVLGLKGRLSARWEWSVDGAIDYTHSYVASSNPPDNLTALQALSPFASPGPAAPATVRRAVYPLFADHGLYPISEEDSLKYFDSMRNSASHGTQLEGNARLLGELFQLPAGPLRTSAVGKYKNWDFVSGLTLIGSDAYSQLINNQPATPSNTRRVSSRGVTQGALEVVIPVIGKKWRPVPVQSFEIQGSYSREDNNTSGLTTAGVPFTNKQSSDSSVIAGRLQITRDLAFRASHSEGFYPPDWNEVSAPTTNSTLSGAIFADPKRGNTRQGTPSISLMTGGNPDLQPETATSNNLGLIFTPRFLPGFTLNVDYWRIRKINAIILPIVTTVIANPDAYGFLITRQEPDADDLAKGWLGRITAVDTRQFNAAVTNSEGFDVRMRYLLKTETLGTFNFYTTGSFTNHFLLSATPTAPIINTAGGSGPLRWRGNGSATWSRDHWSASVTGRYVGHRSTNTTAPSSSFPSATQLDGGRIPAYLHWDLQMSYEIPYRTSTLRDWRTWIAGTRWTIGALNILNDEPAFVSDGSSFYNGADDPRQRYVYVQIKKSF